MRIFAGNVTTGETDAMDPNAVAGMIFTLIMILLIGGMILLYPLSRQLGKLLEQKVKTNTPERDATAGIDAAELRALLLDLQAEVGRVAERQDFFEKLLANPEKLTTSKKPQP